MYQLPENCECCKSVWPYWGLVLEFRIRRFSNKLYSSDNQLLVYFIGPFGMWPFWKAPQKEKCITHYQVNKLLVKRLIHNTSTHFYQSNPSALPFLSAPKNVDLIS